MSKKKSKKFRKIKSHQPSTETTQGGSFVSSDPVLADNAIAGAVKPANEVKADDPYSNNQYDHVRKDIKKILLIIAILILLFVGIYFLGQKTSLLSSIGNWIYKVTNITTG